MHPLSVVPFGPIFADGASWAGLCCGGTFCLGISVGIPILFLKGFLGEFGRGRKMGQTTEEILDELPKKKQVMFKGEKVPDWKIVARQKATKAILKFLSYTDNWFEKKYIADVADEAFRLVKESIEARSIQSIERRVTPECLEEIRKDVKRLRKERERRVFGKVEVTDVDVLTSAPAGKENTFTAPISAKSRDFTRMTNPANRSRRQEDPMPTRNSGPSTAREPLAGGADSPSTDVDHVLGRGCTCGHDLEEFAMPPRVPKEVVAGEPRPRQFRSTLPTAAAATGNREASRSSRTLSQTGKATDDRARGKPSRSARQGRALKTFRDGQHELRTARRAGRRRFQSLRAVRRKDAGLLQMPIELPAEHTAMLRRIVVAQR